LNLIRSSFFTQQNNLWDKKTDEGFMPRKSRKMKGKETAAADGDTWTEYKYVIDKGSGRRRSYFKSKLTRKRRWDEPPSGASNIVLINERQ
jgi:hypothetical protein